MPSRSVKELVEFYYVWKKSKRYEDFIRHGKIGKKKITFQPGQVYVNHASDASCFMALTWFYVHISYIRAP